MTYAIEKWGGYTTKILLRDVVTTNVILVALHIRAAIRPTGHRNC